MPATATVIIIKIVNIVNDMYVPYLYMPKTKLKTLTTFLMNYAGAQQGSCCASDQDGSCIDYGS